MAIAGEFRKINGDVLYAKDINEISSNYAVESVAQQVFGGTLQTLDILAGSATTNINTINAYGRVFPAISGPDVNMAWDNFNDSSIDKTKWISGTDGLSAFNEDNTYMFARQALTNNTGSTWVTGSENIFDNTGGYTHILLGSVVGKVLGGGGNYASFHIKVGGISGVVIYEKLNQTNFATSGIDIQIMNIDDTGFFYRNREAGNAYGKWTGGSIGNGKLHFDMQIFTQGAGETTVGSICIDSVKFMSGAFITRADFDNLTAPSQYETGLDPTQALYVVSGTGVYKNSLESTYALDGTTFTSISNGQWKLAGHSGTDLEFRYIHNYTYGSGLTGGYAVKGIGAMFN